MQVELELGPSPARDEIVRQVDRVVSHNRVLITGFSTAAVLGATIGYGFWAGMIALGSLCTLVALSSMIETRLTAIFLAMKK